MIVEKNEIIQGIRQGSTCKLVIFISNSPAVKRILEEDIFPGNTKIAEVR